MGSDPSLTGFVRASQVRTEVVRALASGPADPAALIAAIDASESAVYNALSALDERGIIRSAGDRWALTGTGWLAVEVLRVGDATETLLELDPAYWRGHDPTVLPGNFRRRLHVFNGGEVFRAAGTDPEEVIRRVSRTIADAGRVDVITPVYHSQYADALADGEPPDARLVFDATLLESLQESPPANERDPPATVDIRVREAPFALVVTPDRVMLSLPTLDGEYDAKTELVADDGEAIRWGRELFERWWTSARPLSAIV